MFSGFAGAVPTLHYAVAEGRMRRAWLPKLFTEDENPEGVAHRRIDRAPQRVLGGLRANGTTLRAIFGHPCTTTAAPSK